MIYHPFRVLQPKIKYIAIVVTSLRDCGKCSHFAHDLRLTFDEFKISSSFNVSIVHSLLSYIPFCRIRC
jgi:hypothetical protein